MSSVETEILNDIVTALRDSGAFALVELGGSESQSAVPRATVVYESRQTFASDGFPTSRWVRLQGRIFIRTRCESPAEGVGRTVDLAQAAADAILQDPYRSQRCHDLPIGRATEVQQTRWARSARYPERKNSLDVRAPQREISLIVRCHYELLDTGDYPTTSTLDGKNLFSSGPCEIRPEHWERKTIQRGFPGIDGELVLDLGLRGRTIVQEGRLQAASAVALQSLISAIRTEDDGNLHTLVDNHGQTYTQVFIEQFQLQTPLNEGRNHWCDYRLIYRQLP